MPVVESMNHTYLSKTPSLKYFTLDQITTDGPKGRILKPEYEEKLKDKLSTVGVILGPDTLKRADVVGPQSFMVYDSTKTYIGWVGFDEDSPFSMHALIFNNQPSTPESISKMKQVGTALDAFATEVNTSLTPKFRGPPITGKFGEEENVLPGAVNAGRRRKNRKTRKHRSRKHKKTRKH